MFRCENVFSFNNGIKNISYTGWEVSIVFVMLVTLKLFNWIIEVFVAV